MSSWMFIGHLALGSAQLGAYLYRVLRPHKFGIYGPPLSGKTTLDQYLTVPGDIEPIPLALRTTHPMKHGQFTLPQTSKKQIRWNGEKIPISTADFGGQARYWNMWAEDMVSRNVSILFYVVDHRVLQSNYVLGEAVGGLKYLVDIMTNTKYPKSFNRYLKKKAKIFKPKVVVLLINKMDVWWDKESQDLWDHGMKRQHPLVIPFQEEMRRLRKAGIATNVEAMSAQYGLNVERAIHDGVKML